MAKNNRPQNGRTAEALRQAFPGLKDDALHALLDEVETKTYPPGHVLCHEGELEHTFYIMVAGRVDVTARMADGQDRLLSERVAGQFFGEMALIEDKPRTATVTTREESTVLEISEVVFDQLLEHNAEVAISVVRELTANLRTSDRASIAELSTKNEELQRAYEELKAAQADIVAKERLEHELKIAAQVQRSLLPDKFPDIPGWEFAGGNEPARVVGGDLFDVIRLDEEHVGLLLADVSDKSVHAALFMGVTRALFHSEAKRHLTPKGTALAVHRGLLTVSSKQDMFVTAFYGVLHIASGALDYVRAGQDYPFVARAAEEDLLELDADGRFLGMLDELKLEEREITLNPGDTLFLYSDGVPDAVNWDNSAYGVERMCNLIKAQKNRSADEMYRAIFDDVFAHRGDAPAADDITILITKFTG